MQAPGPAMEWAKDCASGPNGRAQDLEASNLARTCDKPIEFGSTAKVVQVAWPIEACRVRAHILRNVLPEALRRSFALKSVLS